jgi:RHS repeat-associated protein
VLSPGQAFYLQSAAAASLEIPDPTLRIRYYHEDHLGSSSVITDADGALVEEIAYFPCGLPRHQFQPRQLVEPYLFTQKERDAESGLQYFGARCLASQLSCFISPDPKLAAFGAYNRDRLEKPQSLNPYAFAARNPIKFFDPDGMDVVWSKALEKDKSFQRAMAILKKTDEGKRILAALEKADVKGDVGSLPATEGGDVAGNAEQRASISGTTHRVNPKLWRDTKVIITIDLQKAKKQHMTDYELANVIHHELRHAEIDTTKYEEPDLPYYTSEESLARDEAKRKAATKALDQYIPLGGPRGQGVQSGDRNNLIFQKEIGLLPEDYGKDFKNPLP